MPQPHEHLLDSVILVEAKSKKSDSNCADTSSTCQPHLREYHEEC